MHQRTGWCHPGLKPLILHPPGPVVRELKCNNNTLEETRGRVEEQKGRRTDRKSLNERKEEREKHRESWEGEREQEAKEKQEISHGLGRATSASS